MDRRLWSYGGQRVMDDPHFLEFRTWCVKKGERSRCLLPVPAKETEQWWETLIAMVEKAQYYPLGVVFLRQKLIS